VCPFEIRVFQRNRNVAVDEEQRMNPKLGPEPCRKPRTLFLPLIDQIEA